MKKLLIALALLGTGSAQALPILDPLPDSLVIEHNGLLWAWAGPIAANDWSGINTLYAPELHEGWRFATDLEMAARPSAADFLNADGSLRCASAYWNSYFTHCDYNDGLSGLVSSVRNGSYYETWYVRGLAAQVPEPMTLSVLGLGLLGLAGLRRRA